MNRYAWWKYLIIAAALLVGIVYTLPNFFGEAPAVQLSSGKSTVKIGPDTVPRVEAVLKEAGITPDFVEFDNGSIKARLADTDTQLKARDAITRAFNPNADDPQYIVALNLLSRSPRWLSMMRVAVIEPRPMYLGLDLRGGVHFLMQVDMKAAVTQKVEGMAGDVRTLLRDKDIRHAGIRRDGDTIIVRFRDEATRTAAMNALTDGLPDELWSNGPDGGGGGDLALIGQLKPQSVRNIQDQALKQNITTLHNRINELGVAEPVIQQQGIDRVVVQLPGVQDTARAKDIIGRTATLEIRMVEAHLNNDPQVRDFNPGKVEGAIKGIVPAGTELMYSRRDGREEPLLLSKQVVFSGNNLTGADATIDQQNSGSLVSVTLDAQGGAAMRAATREGVKRRMAVVLIEKGKPEVLTAPTIQSELSNRFQISGMKSPEEANDLALLMRAGSLAAPMEIIEERTVGPSLGADNIRMGFDSLMYGFIAISVFMMLYYLLFGVFSTIALTVNLLLLVAVLSMLQATL
ncbi:MAG: protein translocase subunit SecD, partial [Rubrivivax sp.]